MEALGQTCVDNGEWSPQIGAGDEPQPGPSQQHDAPQGHQKCSDRLDLSIKDR